MESKTIKISKENYIWLLKLAAELQKNHEKPVSFDDAINKIKRKKMKKKKISWNLQGYGQICLMKKQRD